MSLDKFIEGRFAAIIIQMLLFSVFILFVTVIIIFVDNKKCVAYSEPYQKKGFVVVGTVVFPTTYTTKDCVVWETNKNTVKGE